MPIDPNKVRWDAPAQQGIPIKPANPLAPGQVRGQQLSNEKNAGTLPYDIRAARAQAEKAEIDAKNAREQYAAAHPSVGESGLYGAAFLKTLSKSDQNMVKALAEGRLAFPQGAALRAPFWQEKLSQVAQFDPTFDATDFNARAKARASAISGPLGKSNNALNTALGHLGTLYGQVEGTASHGGFPLATTVNQIENAYYKGSGDPGVTNFIDTASKVADELESVYRNGGGAEQGVTRQLRNLDPNMSRDQKIGVIRNAMDLLASKMAANIAQYNFGTMGGKPAWEMLDPHAQQILNDLAPDIRDKYFAVPENGRKGFVPPPTGSGGGMSSSNDGFNDSPDPQSAAFWENAARNRTPYGVALRQWRSDTKARGLQGSEPPQPGDYRKVVDYFRTNQGAEYHPFNSITRTPLGDVGSAANYVASSAPGVATGHFLNSATGGLPTLLAGDAGRRYQAVTSAEHPNAAFAGDLAGTVYGAYRLNKLLAPALANLPGRAGQLFSAANITEPELAPAAAAARQGLASDTAFGTASGAAQNPDHPVAGGVLGAAAMGGGNLLGRYTLGPLLRFAGDTAPGQFLANTAIRGVNNIRGRFGGGQSGPFQPPAPLDPGQSIVANQTGKTLGDIQGRMQEAQSLGIPMALADANPSLRLLAGSATRKSPDVRTLAETVIGPRQLGQAERAIGSIDRHLAPVGDVPAIKADAMARAQDASQPLYAKAMEHPAPSDPALKEMLDTPAGQQAVRNAYNIALNKGEKPGELSFATDSQGNVVINGNPNWKTLQYTKMGLDKVISDTRNPVTGKLDLGDPLNRSLNDLRARFVGRLGELNPDYKAADQAYESIISQGSAAERGAAATGTRVTPEQAQLAVDSAGDKLPYFQRGYASNLADMVDRTRLARDPYEVIYGSPAQQQKMGIVFPQGSQAFSRSRLLEGDMSKTAYETLGGSPTAARTEADKLFDNPLLDAGLELGGAALAGVPPKNLIKRGIQYLGDAGRLGLRNPKGKADQIGPILLNPDPTANLATLGDLLQLQRARQGYVQNARTLGGLLGAPVTFGLYENR